MYRPHFSFVCLSVGGQFGGLPVSPLVNNAAVNRECRRLFKTLIDHLKLLMSQVPYLADVLALKRHLDGAFVVGLFETWLQPSLALGPWWVSFPSSLTGDGTWNNTGRACVQHLWILHSDGIRLDGEYSVAHLSLNWICFWQESSIAVFSTVPFIVDGQTLKMLLPGLLPRL